MTKINITVTLNDSNVICISNGNNVSLTINPNDGIIKASDIFKLFDNGIDVTYECINTPIVLQEDRNLSKEQFMYNDCLDLILSIINSVNQKIFSCRESQKIDENKKKE